MSLPLAIDIVIGLIFIYLTLSLLSSEIQELTTTVLQWRAEHLKKSIINLLTQREFADELYRNPLIRSLNQEGRGPFERFFRRIVHVVSDLYHAIPGTEKIFGSERSAPSYIPADTFSIALLQQINFQQISQRVSELTARRFNEEKLALIRSVLQDLRYSLANETLLQEEFNHLKDSLEEIKQEFVSRRITLSESIKQATEQLNQFIDNTEALLTDDNPSKDIIRQRLPYLKQAILRRQLDPTVAEILSLILYNGEGGAPQSQSPRLREIFELIRQENPELLEPVTRLPDDLKRNLMAIAEHTQFKVDRLEEGVREMEREVANWFDQSMARASGVYKRNAKGVAIIIGCLIAVVINADTLYIVGRLSKDTTLRTSISQAADRLVPATDTTGVPTDIKAVKTAVDQALDTIPLPLGWGETNRTQQAELSRNWWMPSFLQRILGWAISGIAISMGATFWYDVLGKVMRVQNTGRSSNSNSQK